MCVILLSITVHAQEVKKLIITDNLASANKVSFGKPKPAAPKDQFVLAVEDKGTQVLFYVDLVPNPDIKPYILKFTAYKTGNGKDELVDEKELPTKNTAGYALMAFNFFETGKYKVIVTDETGKKFYTAGEFSVIKN